MRTEEQVVDGLEDVDADILRHKQVVHRYQANIDHCVLLLLTKKEDLEQYEKEAALLARVPRATSRERREWQRVVDENKISYFTVKPCKLPKDSWRILYVRFKTGANNFNYRNEDVLEATAHTDDDSRTVHDMGGIAD